MKYWNSKFRDFARDEDGAITAFVVSLFLIMVVGGGMAVDFMRQETMRADLQSAIDRGVLAAANNNQTTDPAGVVRDYIDTRSFQDYNVQLNVRTQVDPTRRSRRVTADAQVAINTFFLKLIGINTLTAVAHGVAEESYTKVEVSLVLDISGSMAWGSRMDDMRHGVNAFIDTMLKGNSRLNTTISLIPYSGQVSLPPNLFAQYNTTGANSYENCIAFRNTDYRNSVVEPAPSARVYDMDQHWMFAPGSYWCPQANSQILPFSNDPNQLKSRVASLTPVGSTMTYVGMKWGVALLDPATRPVVDNLIRTGDVNPRFLGRPSNYADRTTLKILVLMTDGVVFDHYSVNPSLYNSKPESYWHANVPPVKDWVNDTPRVTGSAYLQDICAIARAAGITVYTIGFETSEPGVPGISASDIIRQMKSCASSPNNFFDADGLNIYDTFKLIASDIALLKLTE